MVLKFIFLFLFIFLIVALIVFLFSMFLPSLEINYAGLNSFMLSESEFNNDDLKILWKKKHLPWPKEIVETRKNIELDFDKTEKHNFIWLKLFGVNKQDS